jgi:hypothetical protein
MHNTIFYGLAGYVFTNAWPSMSWWEKMLVYFMVSLGLLSIDTLIKAIPKNRRVDKMCILFKAVCVVAVSGLFAGNHFYSQSGG